MKVLGAVSALLPLLLVLPGASTPAPALEYSTFLGGSEYDTCRGVDVAPDGRVALTGYCYSSDFPVTTGAFDTTLSGTYDAFVCLLSPDLAQLEACTYLGGDQYCSGLDVRFEAGGTVVVAGSVSAGEFPVTPGAFDTTPSGVSEGFLVRFDATLGEVLAGTYIGGSEGDSARELLLLENGDILVCGTTYSPDFPVTAGAFDSTYDGDGDLFVAMVSHDLGALQRATYLGGCSQEEAAGLDRFPDGAILVGGTTMSHDFPTTAGACDRTYNAGGDMVLSVLSPDCGELTASTFVGSPGEDICTGAAVTPSGMAVAAGHTRSADFPVTPGAFDTEWGGGRDGVLFKMDGALATMIAGTFLGGGAAAYDTIEAMTVDGFGRVIAVGYTRSADFPVTPGAFDATYNGESDAILAVLTGGLDDLVYSSFVGGLESETFQALRLARPDRVVVAGNTDSAGYPATPGAFDTSLNGSYDAVVSVFRLDTTPAVPSVVVGPGPGPDNPPMVRVFPPAEGAVPACRFSAYGAWGYGVNVCCGDLDGDGVDEVLSGAGPGAVYGPHVRAFVRLGACAMPLPGVSFLAYGTPKYGVNVAAGDLDGDGRDEIVTGAGPGAVYGPHVRAFAFDGGSTSPLAGVSFFAYGTPKWGVNVAAGDLDGDGRDEIVTGAGPGAVYGPHVRAFRYDGAGVTALSAVSFLAYDSLHFGVRVSCGDVDGDGIDEIITAPGPSPAFGARIRGWNVDGGGVSVLPGFDVFAWDPGQARYGASVEAGADLDGDGRDDLVAGNGPDPAIGTPVKAFRYDGSAIEFWFGFSAFDDLGLGRGAVVAAGRI